MRLYLLCLGAVALEVTADVYLAKWAASDRTRILVLGLILYFLGTILWAFSLRYSSLSRAVVVFTALNAVLGVLAGIIVLGEESTWRLWGGAALVITGLIVVES
jgi:multidrug transporter EmrE-like cation transporter